MEYFKNARRKKLATSILGHFLARQYEEYDEGKFANPPNQPHIFWVYRIESIQLI